MLPGTQRPRRPSAALHEGGMRAAAASLALHSLHRAQILPFLCWNAFSHVLLSGAKRRAWAPHAQVLSTLWGACSLCQQLCWPRLIQSCTAELACTRRAGLAICSIVICRCQAQLHEEMACHKHVTGLQCALVRRIRRPWSRR